MTAYLVHCDSCCYVARAEGEGEAKKKAVDHEKATGHEACVSLMG